MSTNQIRAKIDAIKSFRAALVNYSNKQRKPLEDANQQITAMKAALDEAQSRARRDVNVCMRALNFCRAEAARAAWHGFFWDCSSEAWALQKAQAELRRISQVKASFDQSVGKFRATTQRYKQGMQTTLPKATRFLDGNITRLDAYLNVQLTGTALVAVPLFGMASWVANTIQKSVGDINRVKGGLGEEISAQILTKEFDLQELPFDQAHHGFDRVFRAPGISLIVVESKINRDGRLKLGQTNSGEQGSPEWIAAKGMEMSKTGSAQWTFANEEIARLVKEMGPSNIPALTLVLNPETGLGDVYFRQGDSNWKVLKSGINLEDY